MKLKFTWSLLVSTAIFYGELYAFRGEEGDRSPAVKIASSNHSGPLRRGQVKADRAPLPPSEESATDLGQKVGSGAEKGNKEGAGNSNDKADGNQAKNPGAADGSTQKKESLGIPVKDTFGGRPKINCFKFFASSLGSTGSFSQNPSIYRQIYVKSRHSDGYTQVVEEVNLKDKTSNQLLSFKIPKIDAMGFDSQIASAEGLSLIQYASNLDNCFHGNATIMSFSLKRSNRQSEVEMLKHTGNIVTLSDLTTDWRFWDEPSESLLNFQFDPLIKRNVNLKINPSERIIAIGKGSNKKPYFTFKYPDSKTKIPASIVSYDLNSSSIEKLDLADGEKFILDNQKVGKLIYSEKNTKMGVAEFKNWNSGRKDANFSFDFPKGFFPHQAEFLVNFEKRILVASGQGSYFKNFWRTVLVIDYVTGAIISKLRLATGVAGQLSINSDGTYVVVEEVIPESGERINLHFFDVVAGKWDLLSYKK